MMDRSWYCLVQWLALVGQGWFGPFGLGVLGELFCMRLVGWR